MELTKSMMDITGKVFGSLTAVKPAFKKNGSVHWHYQCNCGNSHIARANTIKHVSLSKNDPELPSCGCQEMLRKTKHGFRSSKNTHPTYRAYRSIMDRCYNTKSPQYKWYGKIGVTVCKAWKNNPKAFCEWAIANGYKSGLHIDKDILCEQLGISPHIYSEKTCQFITPKENVGFATSRDNYGKHPNIKLSHDDVCRLIQDNKSGMGLTKLSYRYGICTSAVHKILRKHS